MSKTARRTRTPATPRENRSNRRGDDDVRYPAAIAAGRRAITERLPFPTDTEILILHQRLLAQHSYAAEAVIERLLPVLIHLIRRIFTRTDEDLIVNAVEDALLEYTSRPEQFDRSRGVPLLAFLKMAATRNATNLVRAESRRLKKEQSLRADSDASPAASLPEATSDEAHDPAILRSAVARIVRSDEKRAVALWLKGERRTEPLAAALGISELPADQRRLRGDN